MKKIISIVLIALLLLSSVLASANIGTKNEKINSLFKTEKDITIESVVDVEDSKEKFDDSKKQEIVDSEPTDDRDFVFFDDPVIFQEFVQFNDYVTMFETYIEYLYADFIEAEGIEVETLEVDDVAFIEDMWVDDLHVEDSAHFENGLEVEEILEVDEILAVAIEVDEIHVFDEMTIAGELTIVDEVRFVDLSQNGGSEFAFACLDGEGNLFRSGIPCNEINSNPQMELWFDEIGEVFNIYVGGQEFEVELFDAFEEYNGPGLNPEAGAVFIVNGDYESVYIEDETNVNGLIFEIEQLYFDDGEFDLLKIVIEDVGPQNPIMIVESFPFNYELDRLYENLRFGYSGITAQDLEVVGVNPDQESVLLEANDNEGMVMSQGYNYTIDGITLFVNDIDFEGDEFEGIEITVYGVENQPNPETPLYPEHFITDDYFNGLFVVGQNALIYNVVFLTEIISDMQTYVSNPIPQESILLDMQVNNIEDQNIIAVGNACDNTVIYNLLGGPEDCDWYQQEGVGILRAVETNENTYTLMVDGASPEDIENAKDVLLDWESYSEDFDLRIGAVCIQSPINGLIYSFNRDYVVSYC